MTQLRHLLTLAVGSALCALTASAQQELPWKVEALSADGRADMDSAGIITATNGVKVTYGNAVLTAKRARVDTVRGDVEAEGQVRLQRDDQLWASEQLRYNFKTRTFGAKSFRFGKFPVFAEGAKLSGDRSNQVYSAEGALVTTDDVSQPFTKVRARSITIYPERIIAHHATMYLGRLPVFYFPYFNYPLNERANQFSFMPGYRSSFGPYLLSTYHWFLNEQADGALHLDYRAQRGLAAGPDLNLHLGRWGEVGLKYYYLHDQAPGTNSAGFPNPDNRQRVQFSYDATPWTNFNVKSQVRYQSDERVLADYFESDYRRNPQPTTFVELNQLWDNFSLDVYAQPRVNSFFETVESLPEVKLTGFRQQLAGSPVIYESESSAGYYRRLFAETNNTPTGLDFAAARADTYHQLVLPETFFGWLNITPRVGGRFGYYSRATGPGATTAEEYRGVFNTGAELTFKASRLWPGVESELLDVHGLRHIVQPSVNYVYVPRPSVGPANLPQFSHESPSLRLLPIEYPDYNAIDAVDSQNVIRLGLANKLQTKRDGQLEDLLRWDLYTDWRLRPGTNQTTFADLWSDLIFRPRNWLTLESQTRFDVDHGVCRMAFHNLTLAPNDTWSWSLGHWYLRDDLSGTPTALGLGNNLVTSSLFYRLNENWAFRASHFYEARLGRLQEQFYTAYRDFRSWTGALTFRVRDNGDRRPDYTVAFTFSLKAMPRFNVGADTVHPYQLIGN
jgi:LPS-assembly protein